MYMFNSNYYSNGQMPARRPLILIVDDNAMILRNIKAILNNDYDVAVAPSGAHALRSISANKPDLILLDYEMPEMNGKQVMEKLLENDDYKDIPVIFLTSLDSRQRVIELLALKPAGYMLKPADPDILKSKVKDILGR